MNTEQYQHIPVLMKETMEFLNIHDEGTYIDCTLGNGGHSGEILKRLGEAGHLYALDQDQEAIARCKQHFHNNNNITFINDNFENLAHATPNSIQGQVDGILADIGISSFQLDDEKRGFSFQTDGPLDMRMNQNQDLSAESVVNEYELEDLIHIIRTFGEEKWAKKIAKNIVREREINAIDTTSKLAQICEKSIPRKFWGKIHPATRTFMAIRIEVNNEMEVLKQLIRQAVSLLKPMGRLCIISFHSLEDRIVKHTYKDLASSCKCPPEMPLCNCGKVSEGRILTNKPVCPGTEEIQQNARSRSSKLRVFEKRGNQ